MDTVDRLLFDGFIPPSVHQKYIYAIRSVCLTQYHLLTFFILTVSHRQIETDAASLERYKQN